MIIIVLVDSHGYHLSRSKFSRSFSSCPSQFLVLLGECNTLANPRSISSTNRLRLFLPSFRFRPQLLALFLSYTGILDESVAPCLESHPLDRFFHGGTGIPNRSEDRELQSNSYNSCSPAWAGRRNPVILLLNQRTCSLKRQIHTSFLHTF